MNKATARATFALAVALFFAPVVTVNAQLVRGVVKSQLSQGSLDRTKVTAEDTSGRKLGETTSDANGRFHLPLKTLGKPFIITVRRLGIKPTSTSRLTFAGTDTAEIELMVEETSNAPLDTVQIRAVEKLNAQRLREAERRGWKLIAPAVIARHREGANTLGQLLQSSGANGITIPRNDYECFRSVRNNKCLTLVLDGQVIGTTGYVLPSDIYFVAIVAQNDAIVQWGQSKAPNGAIAIFTRMNGDRTYK